MRHIPDGVLRRVDDEPLAIPDRVTDHLAGCGSCGDRRALIADDTVRFFYLGNGGDSQDATRDLTAWVQTNCATVPASSWQGTTTGTRTGPGAFGGARGGQQLYDCAAKQR